MASPSIPIWQRCVRYAGYGCVALVVWLSWIPREWEVRTGMAGQFEHVIAYAGTGGLLGLGFGAARRLRLAAGLVMLAGVLEVGQIWIPGRTSQVIDFLASGFGAVVGVTAGAFVASLVARMLPR